MEMKLCITMMFIVLFLGVMVEQGLCQNSDSSCMNRLLPCMNFLNRGKGNPPESCCNPLKEVIREMPECLCQMVSVKGSKAAEQSGIDVNEAQMLPAKCGQPVNYMGCLRGMYELQQVLWVQLYRNSLLFNSHIVLLVSGASTSASNSMGITTSMKILLGVASMILFHVL